MFFQSGPDIAHTLVVGALAYLALVAMLRLSGKRTLAKMNAFDFVVTVALGSTLATVLLSTDVSLLRGSIAIGLLVLLQFVVASLSTRSEAFQAVVKSRPRLLLEAGVMDRAAMREERVATEEMLAAVRGGGYARLEDVGYVVLETDGSFSVLPEGNAPPTALANVTGKGAQ
ncbi:DUF421 domain-containing protein [Amorphus orientalis]|uniref:Uncharacterized membrane protein YcaP (DUF421 family) n=1 Tax=Amorphus orientalis TaxID=649198 RepID=A0AAE3VQK2_9HYPH|nr:YetF domain-containing protein [Amorphus orientalis]MDQ0316128.1 uncharacterized membrane protein YcaP (DUF421 family) [Amorphus orientalis]